MRKNRSAESINSVLLIVFLLSTFTTQPLFGEERDKVHSLYKGALALQFQSSVSSRVIAGKYHLQDDRALQVRLGFNGTYGWNDRYEDSDYGLYQSSENKSYSYDISLDVQYLHYKKPLSAINTYWGIGPGLGYSYSWNELTSVPSSYPDNDGINKSFQESYSIKSGLSGCIGFEWFLKPRFSLMADYRVNVYYSIDQSKSKYRYQYNNGDERNDYHETKGGRMNLNYDRVELGFSFYF